MNTHPHKNTNRLPFPRRVIVIGVLIWIILAGAWSLYLLTGHKPVLTTSSVHQGYVSSSSSSTTFVSNPSNTNNPTDSTVPSSTNHLRSNENTVSLVKSANTRTDSVSSSYPSTNEMVEANNKVYTLQRNVAMKENEIQQLRNQLSKIENDLQHYKKINTELTQIQQQQQQQQQQHQAHGEQQRSKDIVPHESTNLSSSLSTKPILLSPSLQVLDLLRPYIFPHAGFQNAARSAWIRGMLDWHNLVPDVYAIKDYDQATLILQRLRREKAKESLLELVNGWNAPRSLPSTDSNGMIKTYSVDLQTEILQRLSTQFPQLQLPTVSPLIPSVAELDRVTSIVSNATIITSLSRQMYVDGDNIDDYRTPQKDYGPLGKMMACGKVRDPCILHSTPRACVDDEYCGWCPSTKVCVDRLMGYWPEKQAGNKVPVCPDPLLVTADSVPEAYLRQQILKNPTIPTEDIRVQLFNPQGSDRSISSRSVHPSVCSFIITRRRPIVLAFNNGNSKMAFHFFTETAPNWFQTVTNLRGTEYLNLDTYVPQATWNEFPQMITPFSDSCPRILEDISKRNISICYEHISGPTLSSLPANKPSHDNPGKEKTVLSNDKRRRLLTLSDLKIVNDEKISIKEENHGLVQTSSPTNTVLTPENIFGLKDPDLLWIHPVTQRIVNTNEGDKDIPVLTNYGKAVKDNGKEVNHRFPFVLESVTDTVYHGKRLGLTGLATLISYYGSLPYWNTEAGEQEIQQRTGTNTLSPATVSTVSSKLSSRLLRTPSSFPELLLNLLLLQDEGTSENEKPLVTFISRKNKRFIFNEADLIRIALALGTRVAVIALESTPLYEQLTILRRTSILVGMHGSGLINSPIMRPGGVVLQLIPYNVRGASGFFQPTATNAGQDYTEIGQSDRKKTVPHYHFLDNSHSKDYESMFTSSSGSEGSNQAVFFSFWINQDGYVDTTKFGRALRSSLVQIAQHQEKRKEKEKEKMNQQITKESIAK